MNTLVGLSQTTQVVKNKGTQVGDTYKLTAGGSSIFTMNKETIVLNGSTIEITADTSLTLKCGDSTIKLTPALIDILSAMVKINA